MPSVHALEKRRHLCVERVCKIINITLRHCSCVTYISGSGTSKWRMRGRIRPVAVIGLWFSTCIKVLNSWRLLLSVFTYLRLHLYSPDMVAYALYKIRNIKKETTSLSLTSDLYSRLTWALCQSYQYIWVTRHMTRKLQASVTEYSLTVRVS